MKKSILFIILQLSFFFYFCSQNTEPSIVKSPAIENPCVDSITHTKIDVSNAAEGKIIFSLLMDSVMYDSISSSYYHPRQLFKMDTDGSNLEQITFFDFYARIPTLSWDGKNIVFASWMDEGDGINNESIYTFNINNSTLNKITNHGHTPYTFSWSPNNSIITFNECISCEYGIISSGLTTSYLSFYCTFDI